MSHLTTDCQHMNKGCLGKKICPGVKLVWYEKLRKEMGKWRLFGFCWLDVYLQNYVFRLPMSKKQYFDLTNCEEVTKIKGSKRQT